MGFLANSSRRSVSFLALAAVVLLLIAGMHQRDALADVVESKTNWSWRSKDKPSGMPGFKDIALKYGTDKVTTHSYHNMYDKYFARMRDQPIKMLEIGLGCDMNYGPGASYYTWLEFFPHVDLYYMEYDADCAHKWAAKTDKATIYPGDQANATFLEHFAAETTQSGLFDIVVDDGGHTMNQQRISMEHLWKIVRPGGYYVIEDLQTSYMVSYQGDPSRADPGKPTMMKGIYAMLDDIMTGVNNNPISGEVRSVDCMREVCAFTKKEVDSGP